MRVLFFCVGLFFCMGVVLDAFQTIILPRRPTGRLRITRLFYMLTWPPWVAVAESVKSRSAREQIFSVFGPVSLLLLLIVWAFFLITGFGFIFFAFGSPFLDPLHTSGLLSDLRSDLYVSGTTLFTLGLGDVTPHSLAVRALIVLEAGTGLGFVALVIGYVPVIYQAFSRREVSVAMLDGRAGSPPTASELISRHGYAGGEVELIALLAEWERWSAEILESHVSYPLLCYYRSQHDNQSWLSALVCILDACALLITTIEGPQVRQAQLTFAMARHAVIDLGHIFRIDDKKKLAEETGLGRLSPAVFTSLCDALGDMQMRLCGDPASVERLRQIRLLYEPHAQALADYLKMPLPLWVAAPKKTDAWKKVAALTVSRESILRSAAHVSSQAAAIHLHDEDHGF